MSDSRKFREHISDALVHEFAIAGPGAVRQGLSAGNRTEELVIVANILRGCQSFGA